MIVVTFLSCLFHILLEFPVNDFLDFRLQSFPYGILHGEEMLLIPHGIFHGWMMGFDIRHIIDVWRCKVRQKCHVWLIISWNKIIISWNWQKKRVHRMTEGVVNAPWSPNIKLIFIHKSLSNWSTRHYWLLKISINKMKKDEKGMKRRKIWKKNEKEPRHSQKGRKIFPPSLRNACVFFLTYSYFFCLFISLFKRSVF